MTVYELLERLEHVSPDAIVEICTIQYEDPASTFAEVDFIKEFPDRVVLYLL